MSFIRDFRTPTLHILILRRNRAEPAHLLRFKSRAKPPTGRVFTSTSNHHIIHPLEVSFQPSSSPRLLLEIYRPGLSLPGILRAPSRFTLSQSRRLLLQHLLRPFGPYSPQVFRHFARNDRLLACRGRWHVIVNWRIVLITSRVFVFFVTERLGPFCSYSLEISRNIWWDRWLRLGLDCLSSLIGAFRVLVVSR